MGQAWQVLERAITSDTFWSAVGGIATILATAGIFQAAKQLRFDAWLKAQEIFTSFVEQRAVVFSHLADPTQPWSQPDREAGLFVCRRLVELCDLKPFLTRAKILDSWEPPLAKSWALLKWLVLEERHQSGWPEKWRSFGTLGESALGKLPDAQRATLIAARDQSVAVLFQHPTALRGTYN